MSALLRKYLRLMSSLAWLGPLLVRVVVGMAFFFIGKGKLEHMDDRTIPYFTDLGLPLPVVSAWLAAVTECFGGLLLALGLGTRLVSLPLAFTMFVAIVTAVGGDWGRAPLTREYLGHYEWLKECIGSVECTYLVVFLWTLFAGPGPVALDALLSRKSGGAAR